MEPALMERHHLRPQVIICDKLAKLRYMIIYFSAAGKQPGRIKLCSVKPTVLSTVGESL